MGTTGLTLLVPTILVGTAHRFSLDGIKRLLASQDPIRRVFVGDSIKQGAKYTFGYQSFPEVFSERVRWEMYGGRDMVVNSVISGSTAMDILDVWRTGYFRQGSRHMSTLT